MKFGSIDKFPCFLGTMKEPIAAMHQSVNIINPSNNIFLKNRITMLRKINEKLLYNF